MDLTTRQNRWLTWPRLGSKQALSVFLLDINLHSPLQGLVNTGRKYSKEAQKGVGVEFRARFEGQEGVPNVQRVIPRRKVTCSSPGEAGPALSGGTQGEGQSFAELPLGRKPFPTW